MYGNAQNEMRWKKGKKNPRRRQSSKLGVQLELALLDQPLIKHQGFPSTHKQQIID